MPGLFVTEVERLLLAIVPRSEAAELVVVSATLMPVLARTVAVMFCTLKVP